MAENGRAEGSSVQQRKETPSTLQLLPNYPNPFNPSTTLRYRLEKGAFVDLSVYNVRGEKVATLVAEQQPSGEHSVFWQPRSAAGLYLVVLKAGESVRRQKIMLIR